MANPVEEMLVPYLAGSCASPLEPAIVEALRSVYDPEIPVSIFDLGLIYALAIDADGNVRVTMTLTAPTCPVAEELPRWVKRAIAAVSGVESVEIELTWEPFWRPQYMTEEARLHLNLLPTSGELSHLRD
jgi:FeS assembly SUF system protein